MTDLFGLAGREVLFLVFIGCLGFGPSTYLPRGFSPFLRACFAPILGMSIGAGIFTMIEWYIDGNSAKWFVPVVAALSVIEGLRHLRTKRRKSFDTSSSSDDQASAREPMRPKRLISALQILVVLIAVSLPPAVLLASQHSIGPVVYEVYDSPGYVADVDAAQIMTINQADHLSVTTPAPNFEAAHWIQQVITNNRLDVAPLVAAFNALLGLHETDVWAAYLIAILVAGGLALYASICFSVGFATWFACVGAALFGGTFFLQLFADGSQAGIAGLALVVPALMFVRVTKQNPSRSNLFISGLLLAGLSTLYPILVLLIGAVTIGYLVIIAARSSERNMRTFIHELRDDAVGLVVVLAISAVLDVLAFIRNLPSWVSLLQGNGASATQPQYHLGFGVIASWLLQTRDFYSVAFGPQSLFSDIVPALLVPLVVIAIAAVGIRRARAAWIPLAFVVLSALVATKQLATQSCSYCENRSFLPAVPALLFVIFTSAAGYCVHANLHRKSLLTALLGPYLAFVGLSINNERIRFSTNGIFLGDAVRHAIESIPPTNEPVQLEGFGTVPFPAVLGEETLPYEALIERSPTGVSYLTHESGQGVPNALGIAVSFAKAGFNPRYQYLLTRIPQVATGRAVVYESGGVAIEKRHEPLDVTIQAGLNAVLNPEASTVAGWVNGPMVFVISGTSRPTEHLELGFALPNPSLNVPPASGTRFVKAGTSLRACVTVKGSGAVRIAKTSVPANVGVVLTSMRAAYGPCR